jgi:hypothetical protein
VAGPHLSILGLDGTERLAIPGFLTSPSFDRTGAWLAGTHFLDLQDMNPTIEIYSAQTGQPALSLGPGTSGQFQP